MFGDLGVCCRCRCERWKLSTLNPQDPDKLTGAIRFAMTQVNPSEPKSGCGSIVVITRRGLEVGASAALTLTSAELGQRRGVTSLGCINPTPLQISVVEAVTQATPIAKQNTTDTGVSEALGTPVLPSNSDNPNSQDNWLPQMACGATYLSF